ncbi:MAG: hypothetical protein Q3993_07400 [Filifactor alocis]|nr:hypothetical protein [Filifactor alocis]
MQTNTKALEWLMSKPEKELSQEELRFGELVRMYQKIFKDGPPTSPSSLSTQEWIRILEECLSENKTYAELYGFSYEEDSDY